MTIKLRLVFLLGLLLVALGVSLGVLRLLERDEMGRAQARIQRDRETLFARCLEVTGEPLNQYVRDYSGWDDLVNFIRGPDERWGALNLEVGLASYGWRFVRVYDAAGAPVVGYPVGDTEAPLVPERLLALAGRQPFFHYFEATPAGVLEIRGAPVQPSADLLRASAPAGWLVVARRLDAAAVRRLEELTGCKVRLRLATDTPTAAAADEAAHLEAVHFNHSLRGRSGEVVAVFEVECATNELAQNARTDVFESAVLMVFGLLVVVTLVAWLYRWVLRPLALIGDGLAQQSAEPIRPLLGKGDEFGRVAEMLHLALVQRRALEAEIAQRSRVEEELRGSRSRLQTLSDARDRLGRDLHDGVIQNIYAAGLGLATARKNLATDPARVAQALEQCQVTLNETIREVRDFITGLEPEKIDARSFGDIVRALLDSLGSLHPSEFDVAIEPRVGARLTHAQKTHLLQSIREAVSNALRHGRARHVRVHLTAADDLATLEIVDDGGGFDPSRPHSGRGLRNLEFRALVLGGSLETDSVPRGGARIVLRFPLEPFQ